MSFAKLVQLTLPLFLASPCFGADSYALDDAHNHDGTHVEGQEDCGDNYMQPGEIARLGSHSFLILGEDGPDHLLLDHRSGTPPHTYQFILRVRVDAGEMATYRRLLKDAKVSLPAVTTIYFDKAVRQVDRTFFCLQDLPRIFGAGKKPGDEFEKLFPIRASWQKDADFEGAFEIKKSVVPEDPLVLERQDVELIVYRYLPSYLEQASFRKFLKKEGAKFTSILSHAPIHHDETRETAPLRGSYIDSFGFNSNGETCADNYYLKGVRPPKTRHAFLILAETGKNSVLASHLYDQAPQNFQTTLHLTLSDREMKLVRDARKNPQSPPLLMTSNFFCMSEIKDLAATAKLDLKGTLFKNTELTEFVLGEKVGELSPTSPKVLVNRTLQSLMNPQAVARDVFGFVDIQTFIPDIKVEARYFTDWNFIGKPIDGYTGNRCYLTKQAAQALAKVQADVSKLGYSLLVFDCYRPQRAVTQFMNWVADKDDEKMKAFFYPEEAKTQLIKRGYIDSKSGHSRGSTIDLTLVRRSTESGLNFQERGSDCRKPLEIEKTGQLEMGTTYDCFSELAHTANQAISPKAAQNRKILKDAMERHGFSNYPKEWWHFTLKKEPYKTDYFDFEVQ